MLRRWLLVGIVAFATSPAAHAATFARVVSPSGKTIASSAGASFAFPADGSIVRIDGAQVTPQDVLLPDVQLLGGEVDLSQVDLLARGRVLFGPIAAAGRVLTARPNTLVPLGAAGYAVVDQTARLDGQTGRVAVRLVLDDVPGIAKGTEVLIALAQPAPARRLTSAASAWDPLGVLGFSPTLSGAVGFVAAPSSVSGSIGERAVAIAERFIGVPYTWGGASPLTGFDCSGLALYVYAQLGIPLTHYTGAQFNEGTPVPIDELQPGDLVFFEPDAAGVPQHEGIYVGGGDFIQAPHTGASVEISNLADAEYALSFVGAVRPYAS